MVKSYPQLKYLDVISKLKKLGFSKYSSKSRGKGSHEIRFKESDLSKTVVPKHGGKDISLTVIKGICEHIKMKLEDFYKI